MTRGGPEAAVLWEASRVRFRISEDMVSRFAATTGDRSSLHVSEAFARRSAYRRRVAHGMLPVAFLPLLAPFEIEGWRCVPVALSGRFAAPVHAGDELTLHAGPGRVRETGEFDFDYRIEREAAVVTTGAVSVVYERPPAAIEPGAATGDGGLLVRPAEPARLELEQLDVGATDDLRFRVTGAAVRAFVELLGQGGVADRAPGPADVAKWFHLPNLLAFLLLSTSVGSSLPGDLATFLEFSVRSAAPVRPDVEYRLRGTVTHRSMSTRIVRKRITAATGDHPDQPVYEAKVATLVNRPARSMPTVAELKATAVAAGLQGKVALVTGASRGIGETVAKLLALHGVKVVVNYHRGESDAAQVVSDIVGAGGEAVAVRADVSDPAEVAALVAAARARYGTVDILVNNAARDFRPSPFLTLSWDEVQKDLDVIAKGAFLCCQHVVPLMLERGGGKIVSISSVAVDNPPPDQTKYVMAKAALVGLTRSLSIELAARNIQVNLVVPSFVETDFVAHIQDGFRARIAQDTPMRRHASPVEVAQAVVFLVSSHASFTTGQKIMVTGGGTPYL